MTVDEPAAVTTDVDEIRSFIAQRDPAGVLPRCGISQVVVGDDALESVADLVETVVPRDGRLVLLVDPVPIRRGDEDVKAAVEQHLRERFSVTRVVLDDGTSTLHADDYVLDRATESVRDAQLVVTVGGGTVTDVGKWACSRGSRLIPLVVVQTAASVDGFTDDVSVVLRNGVKRTLPTRWPDVVVADLGVIADAPPVMNRAGYGEMLSMFTAPADWFLASRLGLDPSFHDAPVTLLGIAGKGMETWSPGVGRGSKESLRRLVQALVVRGITTGVSGSTAVLSGMEHLVSHMLDLYHTQRGEPTGLHGSQVGVACLVASAAHELLAARLDAMLAHSTEVQLPAVDRDAWHRRVVDAFADVDPSGRVAAECWSDVSAKLDTWEQHRDEVAAALYQWPLWKPELGRMVAPVDRLASGLGAAGGALWFEELEPSASPALARWAVQACCLMRNRFTVVDVLSLLGWWEPTDVTGLLERAHNAADAVRRRRDPTSEGESRDE